jgi:hypothetical protein
MKQDTKKGSNRERFHPSTEKMLDGISKSPQRVREFKSELKQGKGTQKIDDTGYISPYRARLNKRAHASQTSTDSEQARRQLLDIHMKSKKSGIK